MLGPRRIRTRKKTKKWSKIRDQEKFSSRARGTASRQWWGGKKEALKNEMSRKPTRQRNVDTAWQTGFGGKKVFALMQGKEKIIDKLWRGKKQRNGHSQGSATFFPNRREKLEPQDR